VDRSCLEMDFTGESLHLTVKVGCLVSERSELQIVEQLRQLLPRCRRNPHTLVPRLSPRNALPGDSSLLMRRAGERRDKGFKTREFR